MHFDINLVIFKMHENKLILKKALFKSSFETKNPFEKNFLEERT
jgi:hypothetical protein